MGETDVGSSRQFWQLGLESLRAELTAAGNGLTESEARRRIAQYGPNVLRPRRERALLLQFLSRFGNPLIILLIAAATISAFTGDVASFVIIAVVVVLSVTLDFVQEYRAGRAAARLRQSVALRAMVVRGGRPLEILADQIVPGDVVLLEPGGLVPADGRVIEARDCSVNQALLTGEPYPVACGPGSATSHRRQLPRRDLSY